MARTTELHPTGKCKQQPPLGETPGERTPASVKDPPPPTQPQRTPTTARVVPDKVPGEQHARRRGQEKEGGGHAKGAAVEHTTTNRPKPGVAGKPHQGPTARAGEGL